MGTEQQQGGLPKPTPEEGWKVDPCHDATGNGGTEAGADEERQARSACEPGRALMERMMEEVCELDNLDRAIKRVKANKGKPGVDGMTVYELESWFAKHGKELIEALLTGSYKPNQILGVEIPKGDGGKRLLGIPTVVDRVVQQAILQVLDPILDPTFSDSSYGFRRNRSAHDALLQASEYVAEGRTIVVDIDLEKFFDRVNHDILMSRLARRIADKRLLKLIRRFLQTGMMHSGVHIDRSEGTPQGGPLSPLLANLLLDELDKELERRGHKFCRYADDCNIYVQSKAAGERVFESITRFLEEKLKLRVNREKSEVAFVNERKFLGHRLLNGGRLGISPKNLERVKERIRTITGRNRGIELARVIRELNTALIGWVAYFRHAACKGHLEDLDGWIRRKLRCFKLRQCKRTKTIADFLATLGVPKRTAWCTALSGKGWWRLAGSPGATIAMNNQWFNSLGLVKLTQRHAAFNA